MDPETRDNLRGRILLCTHPLLRRKAATVRRGTRKLQRLLGEMGEVMLAAPGLGLAAPQIGESVRCCVVLTPEGEVRKLVNPRIVSRRGRVVAPEGCLSLPTLQGLVLRARKVQVRALDENMKPDVFDAEELYARAIQHELDHLDGLLVLDRAQEGSLAWQVPDEEAEDGVRLEPTTEPEVLAVFARLAEEREKQRG